MPNPPYDKQPRLEGHESGPERRLSDGREEVGEAFADPNSGDDAKLGHAFEESQSSAKKHHRPVKDAVTEPFKKPESRKIFYWIVAGMVVLMLIALIAGLIPRLATRRQTDKLAKEHREGEDKPEIEVMKVGRLNGGSGLVVPGTTTPLTESAVYARASGYLKKRYVDIGDHVREGQLLAVVDAPDLDMQVDQARQQVSQAEAQVEQQKAQLALAKVTNDRYQALVARGVLSRQQGDQQQTNYEAQVQTVDAAQRNVEAFKANLGHLIALQSYERVTAPFSGVITARNVDDGDLISAGGSSGGGTPATLSSASNTSGSQAGASNSSGSSGNAATLATPSTGTGSSGALFTIAQNGKLRIYVSVPEGYADMIKTGQGATLYFQEYPSRTFPANVTRTAGSIDQNTRTMLVELQVDNSKGLLLPGMYAVATFPTRLGAEGPLLISGDAVAIRNDKPTVAVVDNGKIKLVPIVIGRDLGPEVEVVDGLKEGDLIATSFTDEIRDGVQVKTRMNKQMEEKQSQQDQPVKPNPPGGSTQYGDPGITDQDMAGQNAKPQQKQGKGSTKSNGKQGTKP